MAGAYGIATSVRRSGWCTTATSLLTGASSLAVEHAHQARGDLAGGDRGPPVVGEAERGPVSHGQPRSQQALAHRHGAGHLEQEEVRLRPREGPAPPGQLLGEARALPG